jgi:hypothetical protein
VRRAYNGVAQDQVVTPLRPTHLNVFTDGIEIRGEFNDIGFLKPDSIDVDRPGWRHEFVVVTKNIRTGCTEFSEPFTFIARGAAPGVGTVTATVPPGGCCVAPPNLPGWE